MNKARIVEVFESIQGEGKSLGRPSIFIRFFGCNLRCEYCDSAYAVDKEFVTDTKVYNIEHLIKEVQKYKTKHIVFTGGEPLLYQDFIINFIREIFPKDNQYTFEVETNGTIPMLPDLKLCLETINISPKLMSSGITIKKRIISHALKSFPFYKSNFKFVISNDYDLQEAIKLRETYKFKSYLMPEGKDRKTIINNSQSIVTYCIDHGFLFSPREHIIIWDLKKGV